MFLFPSDAEDSEPGWKYIAREYAKLGQDEIKSVGDTYTTNKDRIDYLLQRILQTLGSEKVATQVI